MQTIKHIFFLDVFALDFALHYYFSESGAKTMQTLLSVKSSHVVSIQTSSYAAITVTLRHISAWYLTKQSHFTLIKVTGKGRQLPNSQ